MELLARFFSKAAPHVTTLGPLADITNIDRLYSSVAETLVAGIAETEFLCDRLEPAR